MPFAVSLLLGLSIVAQAPPPPVVSTHAPGTVPPRRLLRWVAGDVICGDRRIPGATLRRPYSALAADLPNSPQVLRFRVGADGRPTGIVRATQGWAPGTEDLAPSLAASRLPAGAGACEVGYAPDLSDYAEIPVGDLVSYTLTPLSGALPEEGWARIRPAGGDCDRMPRAEWRVAVTPDWPAIAAEPGARDWSLVRYDLHADGRPAAVAIAHGTGNAALDRAAVRALSASRQTQGPRHGCLNPYVRPPTRLAAPADVDMDALTPADARCARGDWARTPVLVYPEAWRRRAIEGWAVVAYDVAPWGEPGNVRVLAAEPAAEFGERAVQVIRAARRPASPAGATGCVERVRFAMGPGVIDPR